MTTHAASPIPVRGLDHLVLHVMDRDRAETFYTQVLGCTVERRVESVGLVQLRAGSSLIDLLPARTGVVAHEGSSLDHFCLWVEPFDEARIRAHLEKHRVKAGPTEQRYGAQGVGPSIYLQDPEGNKVELKGPAP